MLKIKYLIGYIYKKKINLSAHSVEPYYITVKMFYSVILIISLIITNFDRVEGCVVQGGTLTCATLDEPTIRLWFGDVSPLNTVRFAVGLDSAGN
jgi:hypothetical protein